MASFAAARQLFLLTRASHVQSRVSLQSLLPLSIPGGSLRLTQFSSHREAAITTRASPGNDAILPKKEDDDDGVSLGTMKLPLDIDLERFDILLFQWANSLCQGANLPLPVPLKVDKIRGGARLGFITVEDNGETQVLVYIDCVVSPATDTSPTPMFRAIRNGAKKDKAPPGEPRIMRSLLAALQKSVEIARV
ncbi:PREDICTED: uncharacterized protein LOC109151859 [Ipomoea nil]|uniref:uncharacterized protein LOC109151859 n=1 Tax=Ipomoea nil TaxID=35883 RepID=UPI000901C832|nr:PREDICTED: uncharacterized protein LOC109151859 [Ipomoea nil]